MNSTACLQPPIIAWPSHPQPTEVDRRECPPAARPAALDEVVARFEAVSLAGLESVALLSRMDAKYVLPVASLPGLIARLPGNYQALDVDGRRSHGYRTLYFDTPEMQLYRAHHDGRAGRFKVRSREYLESGLAFLEVKAKDRRGRTVKSRERLASLVTAIGEREAEFVAAHAPRPVDGLDPVLHNTFTRTTLANVAAGERVTIDTALAFSSVDGVAVLPGVAVLEVKTASALVRSPVVQALRAMNLRPTAFSKYCIGVALLRQDQKHNRFRPQLLRLERISGGAR